MRNSAILTVVLLFAAAVALVSREPQPDPRLKNAFRRPSQNGWTYIHLEGAPAEMGYQHGFLLAPDIRDAQKVISLELTHDTNRDWKFFRDAAKNDLWPHVEAQYREELEGIAEGARARGVKLDVWDVVVLNAFMELNPNYVNWYDKLHRVAPALKSTAPEHCSAFVATGRYTKDGRMVIGHNAWTGYLDGERWTMIFDIAPASGHRILMDGFPGLIHSADDFGVNDAGMAITETTISRFHGWNPDGIPEFVRARKAMQYSSSIDEFATWMKEGNNGGYANTWLAADRKTNEIASLELGLKNVTLQRTKDGYFVGSNFPANEKLIADETEFDVHDMAGSANARRVRWEQLMEENKGKIDVAAGQRFLADHYDSFAKKEEASERTLCGHIDLSPRGAQPWQLPYGIAGAVQNKVTDAAMAEQMSFTASAGHACGLNFHAAEHLNAHPEFAWQKELLHDMPSGQWTTFRSSN